MFKEERNATSLLRAAAVSDRPMFRNPDARKFPKLLPRTLNSQLSERPVLLVVQGTIAGVPGSGPSGDVRAARLPEAASPEIPEGSSGHPGAR